MIYLKIRTPKIKIHHEITLKLQVINGIICIPNRIIMDNKLVQLSRNKVATFPQILPVQMKVFNQASKLTKMKEVIQQILILQRNSTKHFRISSSVLDNIRILYRCNSIWAMDYLKKIRVEIRRIS